MTDILDTLNDLRNRMDALVDQPLDDTHAEWQDLRSQIDALCTQLEQGDPETARAALASLAEMITLAERVAQTD